jgi:hypothetical protein
MDTLAVQLTVPLAGPVLDFHQPVNAPCRAHKEKPLELSSGFVSRIGEAPEEPSKSKWFSAAWVYCTDVVCADDARGWDRPCDHDVEMGEVCRSGEDRSWEGDLVDPDAPVFRDGLRSRCHDRSRFHYRSRYRYHCRVLARTYLSCFRGPALLAG